MNPYYYYPRSYQDARFGPLLPFLAGVLVTTPFIFLNKNNQPNYVYQQPMMYQPYMPYPYYGYTYSY